MQILDPEFEVRLVILPRHTIHSGGGFALKRVERRPERVDIDMVEERSELFLLPLPCIHRLRHRSPGFVRRLRRYYAGVRLLWVVHQRLRLLTFPLRTIRPPPRPMAAPTS